MDLTTKVHNTSDIPMLFVSKNQFAVLKTKTIGAGEHIYLPYRDGMVSWDNNIENWYEIYPADRDDGWDVRATFLPIQLYDNSEIKISYSINTGGRVVLTFEPATGFLQRMRISRWVKDISSGLLRFRAS